ncbi:MAG: hypothetical protein PF447_02980 [Spirochaetaceae bacterium]|jgi:uncharacterized protein YeeX (DUF496 family)|nr:hypothetical protein [Spirochaetaceae bacterium]
MKSTDLARKERELKRVQKKSEVLARKQSRESRTPGDFINQLHDLFFHDLEKIYNIDSCDEILEILLEMKEDLEEKHWDNVIRKAVRKTKIKEKEEAITLLKELAEVGD